MLSVEDALHRVLAGLEVFQSESVPLEQAHNRVLAEDVAARITQPPFNASAMDGYGVRANDLAEIPCALNIIGEAAAGHPFNGEVGAGEAVRIFTGAPLPSGTDTIVIQEDTERNGNSVTIMASAEHGTYVRPSGFDFSEGDVLLKAGRRLLARDLSLAAAMNLAQLPLRRKPVVAILATGDELVMPGETLKPGQIIASNAYGLTAMISAAGGEARVLGIARDSRQSLAEHIAMADNADILLTIGGASVGDHDLVQEALETAGMTLDFWKIAMRPGKPLMFGRRGAQRVLGLPGNPVSAMICARIFLIPMLEKMLGIISPASAPGTAILTRGVKLNGPRQHYMRAILETDAQGALLATPVRSQDSSLLSPMSQADALIIRPPNAPAAAEGESVDIVLLDF